MRMDEGVGRGKAYEIWHNGSFFGSEGRCSTVLVVNSIRIAIESEI